jgi:hypothetical protein
MKKREGGFGVLYCRRLKSNPFDVVRRVGDMSSGSIIFKPIQATIAAANFSIKADFTDRAGPYAE